MFGLAQNERLIGEIKSELDQVAAKSVCTGRPQRRFKTFMWQTRRSWSRRRRVVAKAEWTKGEANPRFIVTSLRRDQGKAKYLYEKVYCARGDMENRIKECQLDLYADRTSTATMRANQLRLWFASMAYVLLCALRRIGLHGTTLANATWGPSGSNCSRSVLSCASVFAASDSPWHRPVPPPKSGVSPPFGSRSLLLRAPLQPDTRRRTRDRPRRHF